MNSRTTMTICYKSLKKDGVDYFNNLLAYHQVIYDIKKISLTEIASFLTEHEKKVLSKYDNKWTFSLFLRCIERFIKSKRIKKNDSKNRISNSVYKIKFTGMIN